MTDERRVRFEPAATWFAAAIPVLAIAATLHAEPGVVRFALLALAFCVAPGYVLQAWWLTPRATHLGFMERAGLGVGVSIAVTALLTTLLNYTPFGIRLLPLLVVLSAVSVTGAVAVTWREGVPQGVPRRWHLPATHVSPVLAGVVMGVLPLVAIVAVVQTDPWFPRWVLVALAVTTVPGYVVHGWWTLPGAGTRRPAFGVTVGAVAALGIAAGIAVHPGGASAFPFIPILGALSLLSFAVAGAVLVSGGITGPRGPAGLQRVRPGPRLAVYGLAVCVTLGAAGLLVAAPSGSDRSQLPFTELTLTNADGELGNLPQELSLNESAVVNLHVVSHEDVARAYTLQGTWNATVFLETDVTLAPGGAWAVAVTLPTEEVGEDRVRFRLLVDGDEYRSVGFPLAVTA